MTQSGINIDPAAVQSFVTAAILQQITPEQRDTVIQQAVQYLITTPPRETYGAQRPAPLQDAFNSAVHQVARQVVMEDEEIRASILEAVTPVIAEIASKNYDGLPEAIGAAVASWLQERSRA